MLNKLCILLLGVLLVVPAMAQQKNGNSDNTSFAPKAGQWQVSAVIGKNTMFNQNLTYLLPSHWSGTEGNISFDKDLGIGNTDNKFSHDSDSPGAYLSLGNINSNSLVNLIGLQAKYFVTDRWDLNLMFSMNINATPSKDYIEGEYEEEYKNLPIQAHEYIEGKMQNLWSTSLGSNYYFNMKNERISLYLGGVLGWQMGRIKAVLPHTGYTILDEDLKIDPTDPEEDIEMPLETYVPSVRAGQIWALRSGVVTGIEYSIAKGLVIGLEVQPFAYTYTHFHIASSGQGNYHAGNHNIEFLATPNFKFGFRF